MNVKEMYTCMFSFCYDSFHNFRAFSTYLHYENRKYRGLSLSFAQVIKCLLVIPHWLLVLLPIQVATHLFYHREVYEWAPDIRHRKKYKADAESGKNPDPGRIRTRVPSCRDKNATYTAGSILDNGDY